MILFTLIWDNVSFSMNQVFVVLLFLKAALSLFLYLSFLLPFNKLFLKEWCLLALFSVRDMIVSGI